MSKLKNISTPNAPKAIGPYSQAIEVNGFLFCSGQIPLDPATGNLVEGDIQAQTVRVLQNIEGLLKARNLDFSHVIKSTVFLKKMSDFAVFNEVYAKYFKEPYPARSTVEVSALPKGAQIEIEVIALWS
jgi:2-iminobutanoate/2-iminopropanoate deaminase